MAGPKDHYKIAWLNGLLAVALLWAALQAQVPDPSSVLIVTSPDAALMERALLLLGQNQQAEALDAFQELITKHPNSPRREEAVYRLAECYRRLARPVDAVAAFGYYVKTFPQELFVAPAELRLGELLTQQGKFQEAIPYLERVQATQDPASQGFARFYLATCYLETDRITEGRKLLEAILALTPPPPYALTALIRLADTTERAKESTAALELWKKVPTFTGDKTLRAQASARAGWLSLQLGKTEEAEKQFQEARKQQAIGDWRKLANTGLLRVWFEQKRDDDVARLFAAERTQFLDTLRGDIFFQAGTALVRLKRYSDAVSVLDLYLKDFATTTLAPTVAFQRLVSRRELNKANVAADTETFLRTYGSSFFGGSSPAVPSRGVHPARKNSRKPS